MSISLWFEGSTLFFSHVLKTVKFFGLTGELMFTQEIEGLLPRIGQT